MGNALTMHLWMDGSQTLRQCASPPPQVHKVLWGSHSLIMTGTGAESPLGQLGGDQGRG